MGLSLLFVLFAQQVGYAQRFINEIKAFKKQDSLHPAPQEIPQSAYSQFVATFKP